MSPIKSRIKVAVVGAGAAGLCAGRHLLAEPIRFTFDVFEQQHDVGGTWRFTPQIHKDDFGLHVHSSMYKNLRTNLPKETMAFPGFPFPDCDGKSFLHHTDVLAYLESYAKHYELYKHIKFHSHIENVKPLKHADGTMEWAVSTCNLITKEKDTNVYDAIMVCNGHYSIPSIPEIEGLSDFKGIVLHSHDYREPDIFKNLKVVVLGIGASGIDISVELSTVAKEVILSHNQPPRAYSLPANLEQEKGIESVSEHSVRFFGGRNYPCDAIVLCTGYLYEYSFLDASCNVSIGDQRVSPLYMHLFHAEFPTLSIFAVPKLILPFPIYDQQVRVFLKSLKGAVELPSMEDMKSHAEKEFESKLAQGFRPKDIHVMPGQFQWEYDDALSKLGKIQPIPDVVRNLFKHVHQLRTQSILTYKDKNFKIVDEKSFVQIN